MKLRFYPFAFISIVLGFNANDHNTLPSRRNFTVYGIIIVLVDLVTCLLASTNPRQIVNLLHLFNFKQKQI